MHLLDPSRGWRQASIETFATNLGIGGFGLVSGVLIARSLGPEGRGALAAMMNWPMLLTGFGSLGLMSAAAYSAGREPEAAPAIFATTWALLVPLAAIVVAIGYLAMPLFLKAQSWATVAGARLLLLVVLVRFAGDLPHAMLQGMGRLRVWNVIRVLMPVFWLAAATLAFIVHAVTPRWFVLAFLGTTILHCGIQLVAMFRVVQGHYRPETKRISGLLRYGLPVALTQLPGQANLRLDQLLMASLLPASELGLYVTGVAWAGILAPLSTTAAHIAFPLLTSADEPSLRAARCRRISRLSALLMVGAAALLSIATPVLYPLLFGVSFSGAIPVVIVLVWAAAIAAYNQVLAESAKGLGEPMQPLVAECVGLGVTVLALPFALLRFGIMGAAVVSVAAYLATTVTYLVRLAPSVQGAARELLVPSRAEFSG